MRLWSRFSLTSALLAGLLQYEIASLDDGPIQSAAQSMKEQKPSKDHKLLNRVISKKKRKRLEKEKKRELDLGVADKIIQVSLSKESLEEMEFFNVYDNMVSAT